MSSVSDPADLLAAARAGDRSSLARVLSLVERGGAVGRDVGRLSYAASGNAYTIGLTGAPGAGKSTLTSALIGLIRSNDEQVAVLAIDPSSPFSGGAILGDRIRMQDHATDPGVFIRSMATRGHLGGLAVATPGAVRVLDATGWNLVLIETVGVGQVEVEVAGKADTTVVVVNPGWGDSVQASKAGLMEIADVFVINKADRAGVEDTRRDLVQMLELSNPPSDTWRPPVLTTVATDGTGIDEVWAAVIDHRTYSRANGTLALRRELRARDELRAIVAARLGERARELCTGPRWDELTEQVAGQAIDPWTAADAMLAGIDA